MLGQLLLLIIGFVLLVKGADYFVDGAGSVAAYLKVPTIIVGLTIVAFGTSAPEAAISMTAAFSGSNDLAVSNVIGSNIFNLLVVLGATTFITSIPVAKSVARKEFPFLILVSFLIVVMIGLDFKISQMEGFILLLLTILYVTWLIKDSIDNRAKIEVVQPTISLLMCIVFIVVGITGIIVGGNLVVDSAQSIAISFGLSEKLVGLTIVSVGTSLPELVTSLVAAKKGEVDILIGNIVGSSILNIIFILGLSSSIKAISVDVVMILDLVIMLTATLWCFLVARTKFKITKKDGILFLSVFILYMIYVIIRN